MHLKAQSQISATALLFLLLFTIVKATTLVDSGHDHKSTNSRNIDAQHTKISVEKDSFNESLTSLPSEFTLRERQHATSTLRRRSRPIQIRMTYRFYEVYVVKPVSAEIEDIGNDIWQAFVSYNKAVSILRDDYPPYFNLTLGYGRLSFTFSCANPLHSEDVREILSVFLLLTKVGWAAFSRAVFWSLKGTAIAVIFTFLPRNGEHLLIG